MLRLPSILQTGNWSVKAPLPACSAVYDGVGDLWYSSRQADGSCGAVTVCRGGLEGEACQQVGWVSRSRAVQAGCGVSPLRGKLARRAPHHAALHRQPTRGLLLDVACH